MKTDLLTLMENIKRKNPANVDEIKYVAKALSINFPEDYFDWLLLSDGGSGFVGEDSYLLLWSLEQILSFNASFRKLEIHIPTLVMFGSDGGEVRYAYDTQLASLPVVEFYLESLDTKSVKLVGENFSDFLRNLSQRKF